MYYVGKALEQKSKFQWKIVADTTTPIMWQFITLQRTGSDT